MVRLLFSGDTSARNLLGKREKSRETGFPYVEKESLRYVSEAEFIEIRAYACSVSGTSPRREPASETRTNLLTTLTFLENTSQALNFS